MSLEELAGVTWANVLLNISTVVLLLVQLALHQRGWTKGNGWHPPDPDRRSGHDRRQTPPPA